MWNKWIRTPRTLILLFEERIRARDILIPLLYEQILLRSKVNRMSNNRIQLCANQNGCGAKENEPWTTGSVRGGNGSGCPAS